MKNYLTLSFALAAIIISFQAKSQVEGSRIVTIKTITKELMDVANSYAKGVSCVEDPVTPKTIFALKPINLDTSDDFLTYGDGEYLAFWWGSVNCGNGNKSNEFHHAFIRGGDMGFYVDPSWSAPIKDFPEKRFIEKFVGNTKNTIVIDALAFQSNDGNCCPSLKYRYTFQIDDKGNWREVQKKSMPYDRDQKYK